MNNTKKRSETIAAYAAAILSASGVDVSVPTPSATITAMAAELVARAKCSESCARNHIARAMRRARGEIVRGRGAAGGEANPRAKVTWAIVREMREAHAAGANTKEIAERYSLKYPTAHAILSGRRWVETQEKL